MCPHNGEKEEMERKQLLLLQEKEEEEEEEEVVVERKTVINLSTISAAVTVMTAADAERQLDARCLMHPVGHYSVPFSPLFFRYRIWT